MCFFLLLFAYTQSNHSVHIITKGNAEDSDSAAEKVPIIKESYKGHSEVGWEIRTTPFAYERSMEMFAKSGEEVGSCIWGVNGHFLCLAASLKQHDVQS